MKFYNHKGKIFYFLILSCVSFLGFSQTSSTQHFHDTKGNIEVTQAGQLQYTLTIEAPPGVQKATPNISLLYVSGAGNGLAGYGWNISGLTAISRTGKNIEKDGVHGGVNLDYTDYYSFNGQRLILKSGEYGKDGAEYVTEKYSNIRIKSIGTISGQAWQGPEYWEVTFDDSSQAWYGATTSGSSSARTPIDYNIVKSRDKNGNYITYSYVSEGNVSLISNIRWGGNDIKNTAHFNKIDFVFNARPVSETAYIRGVEFTQSKLLTSIIVMAGASQYKKYDIAYKDDYQQTGYKYVDKITVANGMDEASNPVLFKYEQSFDPDRYSNPWQSTMTLRPNPNHDVVGDFDGDGNLDLLRFHTVTSTKIPQVGLYLYSNFYMTNFNWVNPVFVGNTLSGLKNAIAVNLKKNNLIRNRQGFVIQKLVTNPVTSKSDLELSFYGITENNQLVLDYKKIIPNANYDNSYGSSQDGVMTTVVGMKNVDFNGDGLSEIVLQLNDKTCTPIPINPAKLPHTCTNETRYYVVDPDESIQNNDWFYPLNLYPDYNKMDKDLFAIYKAGDFNGDGLFDFMKIDQDLKPILITFKKNSQGKYFSSISPFNPANDETIKGYWEDALVGDFNGDGLSDLMMPGTSTSAIWYLYTSKGNGFKEETRVFERPERNRTVNKDLNQNIFIKNPRTFTVYDINNDGKSELIYLESDRNYYKSDFQDSNQGMKYEPGIVVRANILSACGGNFNKVFDWIYPANIYLNSTNIDAVLAPGPLDLIGLAADQWTGSMFRRLMMVSAVGAYQDFNGEQRMTSQTYFDIAKEGRITSISQGGITTNITYKQLDKVKNPGLYDGVQADTYPYVEINQSVGMYVVSGLVQTLASDKKLKQDFMYRGLTSNILGRGMIGFKKTARSSWYADGFENTKIWHGTEIDPSKDGLPVKQWQIRTNDNTKVFPADVSESNTQLLSFTSTNYKVDKIVNGQVVTTVPIADNAKVVTAIIPDITKSKDFLTGVTTETTVTYGSYYLPSQSTAKVNTSYGLTTSTYKYIHNPSGTGSNYYIGRPESKTETAKAYNDTKSGKEEYTYEGNHLKTVKKWNGDNTGYLLETYSYDGFGNITQKLVSNSIDSKTWIAKTEYETNGRFALKQTDNLGLVTQFTYNNMGQVLTTTDQFGNSFINTYDNWGKLLSSKSSLSGTTTYSYERDTNANITVTENEPNGNVTKVFTNKLGQEYKTLTKAFGQGQFVAKEIVYDILGRKVKESEPYFDGQTADVWNSVEYDDTVYPVAVKATSFTGKQTETIVSGLTTKIKESNQLDYGRSTTKTADPLGNIISSTDEGGTIQYSYDATGRQTQAKYAENSVVTKYDSWGRKMEFNDPSNGAYKYEYDGLGQLTKIISPKGTKEYDYNSLGQLISQKELSTIDGGVATNKTIAFVYNTKGQLTSKSGTSKGLVYSTVLAYDPQGRLLTSTENSNGKKFITKGFIYDDKGRVISYEKELQSSGITTKAAIQNLYSPWNGDLYQIKDKTSGKILWEMKQTNARGQTTKENLGAVEISNAYNDATGLLQEIKHLSPAQQSILNIQYTFDAIRNELKSRKTLGDFNILESFNYDTNNRLTSWTNPVTGQISKNTYDVKGRITLNDQVGTIKFENPAKLYQPTSMTLNAAGIQNYNGDLIQTITYNENNDPIFIDGEKGNIAFNYGLTSMRQKISYGGQVPAPGNEGKEGKFSKFYNEDGSFEITRDAVNNTEKHILYIGGTPYESDIVYLKDFTKSSGSFNFLHKDYLGSILAITDDAGNKIEQRHYDAWGNFTHLKIGTASVITDKQVIATTSLITDRGYTGHEHLMDVGIIHMNGRLYDPLLRRFLNADENIQDPDNTQNYNKYGYVLNNPLMYNDPDGEWWWLLGAAVGGYLNGVAANNGKWNPGKWDWEKTWSAVLGGAVGGAAISGTLGNIAHNAGAIKTVLPGIISGGLNSAFTGSNFLGGAMGGLTYSNTMFTNKITSTNGVNAGYKYIISPDYNDEQDEGPGHPGKVALAGALVGSLTKGTTVSAAGPIGVLWYVMNGVYGSAHIPNHAEWAYKYTPAMPLSITEVKAEYKVREKNTKDGSYTIIFGNNQKYHGKGPLERMFTSAILQMTRYRTTVKSFDWTPSSTTREAFKAEYRRMQTDKVPRRYPEGYMNPINYNIIQSPGKKYELEDGY